MELCWVPSHVGNFGNDRADQLASYVAKQLKRLMPNDYNDFFNHLRINMNQVRSYKWQQSDQKQDRGTNTTHLCKNRQEEVVVTRLRLSHCWFSHDHLMKTTDGPRVPPFVFFALWNQ